MSITDKTTSIQQPAIDSQPATAAVKAAAECIEPPSEINRIFSFIRKVMPNQLGGKNQPPKGMRQPRRPPSSRQTVQEISALSADSQPKQPYDLQRAASELQARMSQSSPDWPVAMSRQNGQSVQAPAQAPTNRSIAGATNGATISLSAGGKPGTVYKYRSKASITYTNLPAIVVNQ
jgi:hypothetical protein